MGIRVCRAGGQAREIVKSQPRLWFPGLSGYTDMRLLQHPEQFSSVMLKSPTPQKAKLGELCYITTNLPFLTWELTPSKSSMNWAAR